MCVFYALKLTIYLHFITFYHYSQGNAFIFRFYEIKEFLKYFLSLYKICAFSPKTLSFFFDINSLFLV